MFRGPLPRGIGILIGRVAEGIYNAIYGTASQTGERGPGGIVLAIVLMPLTCSLLGTGVGLLVGLFMALLKRKLN